MKKILFTLAAVLALSSCTFIKINGTPLSGKNVENAAADVLTKSFEVADFDVLTINVPADVIYEATNSAYMEVSAPSNVIDQIVLTQEDGQLKIAFRDKIVFRGLKHFKIHLGSATLAELNVNGAADFNCLSGFKTGNLNVKVSGAGDLDLAKLEAENVTIRINGAGDLDMKDAKCASLDITVSGAGDVDLDRIDCEGTLKVVVNGAGDAVISGKAGEADLTINGAGKVDVRNLDGPIVNSSVNGVGSISKRSR